MVKSLKNFSGESRRFGILDSQKESSLEYKGNDFDGPQMERRFFFIEINEENEHPIRIRRKKAKRLCESLGIIMHKVGETFTELEKSLIDKVNKICKGTDMELSQYQAILVKSLDILSEKEEKELDSLLDKDSTTVDDVLKFLKSKIPTFDLLVKEEGRKIKDGVFATA